MKIFRRLPLLLSALAIFGRGVGLSNSRCVAQPISDASATETSEKLGIRLVPPIGHKKSVTCLRWRPDGKYVLSGATDGWVILWEVATGREVRRFFDKAISGNKLGIKDVAFSDDGQRVWVEGDNLSCWDIVTGKPLKVPSLPIGNKSFNPDGTQVSVKEEGESFSIWSLKTGQLVHKLEGTGRMCLSTTWSPDGRLFVAGVDDVISVWEAKTGRLVRKLRTNPDESAASDQISSVTVSQDGHTMAAYSYDADNTTFIWDLFSGKLLKKTKSAPFARAFIDHDSNLLCFDGRVVSATSGQVVNSTRDLAIGSLVEVASEFPGEGLVVYGQENGQIKLLSSHDGSKVKDFNGGKIVAVRDLALHAGKAISIVRTGTSWAKLQVANANVLPVVYEEYWVPRRWDPRTGQVLADIAPTRTNINGTFKFNGSDVEEPDDEETVDSQLKRYPYRSFYAISAATSGVVTYGDTALRYYASANKGVKPQRSLNGPMAMGDDFSSSGKENFDVKKDTAAFLEKDGDGARIRLWNISNGSVKSIPCKIKGFDEFAVANIALSDDAGWCLLDFTKYPDKLTDSARRCEVFEVATGKSIGGINHNFFTVEGKHNAAFRPQSQEIVLPFGSSTSGGSLALYNWKTGKKVRVFAGEYPRGIEVVRFDAAGKRLVTGSSNGIIIYDTASGKVVHRLTRHTDTVTQVAFLNDNTLVSAADDNTQRVWDLKTGKEIYTYLTLRDGGWFAFTPDGRYDGTPEAIKQIYFARGIETFDAEQFAEQFFTPGLVALLMRGEKPPMPINGDIQSAISRGTPPEISISASQPLDGKAQITVKVREKDDGGIKAIRLYLNGRLINGPLRLRGIVVEAPVPADDDYTKTFSVDLMNGENVLRAVAYSRTDLESRPAEVRVNYATPQPNRPTLRVLAVGINVYRDPTLKLEFARQDAQSVASFFQAQKGKLYGPVVVTSLLDAQATGEAIRAQLAELGKDSTRDDVVVIYFAGHGETAPISDEDNEETFYFLPHEMRQIALKERVRELGVSGQEIENLLAKINARKIVLIYDSCKSGAAVKGGIRGTADEQKALSLLARAQGIHILTASSDIQSASEVGSLGHGVLTYALLEALQGKAAQTDGTIMVRETMSYVEKRVPELTKELTGQEQFPVPFNRGNNFPLAQKP